MHSCRSARERRHALSFTMQTRDDVEPANIDIKVTMDIEGDIGQMSCGSASEIQVRDDKTGARDTM